MLVSFFLNNRDWAVNLIPNYWSDHHCRSSMLTWNKLSLLIPNELAHRCLVFVDDWPIEHVLLRDYLICLLRQAVLTRLHRLKDNWVSFSACSVLRLSVLLSWIVVHRLASVASVVNTTILVYIATLWKSCSSRRTNIDFYYIHLRRFDIRLIADLNYLRVVSLSNLAFWVLKARVSMEARVLRCISLHILVTVKRNDAELCIIWFTEIDEYVVGDRLGGSKLCFLVVFMNLVAAHRRQVQLFSQLI